jgi:hypothetical protein
LGKNALSSTPCWNRWVDVVEIGAFLLFIKSVFWGFCLIFFCFWCRLGLSARGQLFEIVPNGELWPLGELALRGEIGWPRPHPHGVMTIYSPRNSSQKKKCHPRGMNEGVNGHP